MHIHNLIKQIPKMEYRRMTYHYSSVFTFILSGAISVTVADTPHPIADALTRISATNYAWSVSTETPGAPFSIAPVRGKVDASGLTVMESEVGGKVLQAAVKGDRRVIKTDSGWKASTEIADKNDSWAMAAKELLNVQSPADELGSLFSKLADLQSEKDGSFAGTLKADAAKAFISSAMKGRLPGGMSPDIRTARGRLHLWLKDGIPEKYILTITATVSLPFGSKDIERISTVEVRDIGSTRIDLPPEEKKTLDACFSN